MPVFLSTSPEGRDIWRHPIARWRSSGEGRRLGGIRLFGKGFVGVLEEASSGPQTYAKLQYMEYVGVTFLNNDTTPMEKVVHMLSFAFGHKQTKAFELMFAVHRKGSALVAIVPTDQWDLVLDRLDTFNKELEPPIDYRTLPNPEFDEALLVDASDLPDRAEWEEQQRKENRGCLANSVILAIILFVFVAIIFWN